MHTKLSHFLKNFVLDKDLLLSIIKVFAWTLSWTIGVYLSYKHVMNQELSEDSSNLFSMWGGSCLVFSISLTIEIIPNIKNASTKYRRGFYTSWLVVLLVTVILSIALMSNATVDDSLCIAIFAFTVVSLILLIMCFLASFIIFVFDGFGKSPNLYSTSTQAKSSEELAFERRLEGGQLGSVKKEENDG